MPHVLIPDEEASVLFASQTGVGPYAFGFTYFEKPDLRVRVGGVDIAQGNFSVAGNALEGGFDGGEVTLVVPAANQSVLITREKKPVRITDFSNGPISARNLNTELDKMTAIVADVLRKLKNAILRSPEEIGDAPIELPAKATRAETVFTFDAEGAPDFTISRVDVALVASISSEIQALAEPSVVSAIQDLSPAEVIAALLILDNIPAEIALLGPVAVQIGVLGTAPYPGYLAALGPIASSIATTATNIGLVSTVATDLGLGASSLIKLAADDLALGAGSFILRAPGAAIKTLAYADADVDVPVEFTGQTEGVELLTFNPATAVNLGTNVITYAANGLFESQQLQYRKGAGGTVMGSTGSVLTDNLNVYAVETTTNTFKISLTEGGTAIDLTTVGAGTAHQFFPVRSAKHHHVKAKAYADSARSDAINTADDRAAIEQVAIGTVADVAAAAVHPNAVEGLTIFKDLSDGLTKILTSKSPPDAAQLNFTGIGVSAIASFQSAAAPINTTGKFKGRMAFDEFDRVWVAIGAVTTDKWRPFHDMNGFSDITPA